MAPLLEIKNLVAGFETPKGFLRAVDGASLTIEAGESVGLVGESGCGKSATAFSILQLLPHPAGVIKEGTINFEGKDLRYFSEKDLCKVRGKEIAMIFQEPMSALNPVMRVAEQIAEALLIHGVCDKKEAYKRVEEMLKRVGIPPERAKAYPHELSGGMRQRVLIAMALICKPKLIIADEPTTALDVTLQNQILELIKELQQETKAAVLFITHDLGVVKKLCDRTYVMYAGQIVESGKTAELFAKPAHPYTEGLLRARPSEADEPKSLLRSIEGRLPSYWEWEAGCRFRPRCPYATEACKAAQVLKENARGVLRCCERNK